jgi:CRISPR-associated protein Csx17
MHTVSFPGCTATPFGGYLKALGVLRLISDQADSEARGWWAGETFTMESSLDEERIATFFLERYKPTPILAPWNGGSGFYPKDNKDGIVAVANSSDPRFGGYRESIAICREMEEVVAGKGEDEDERRTAILRHCRNRLPDDAVEWLDAAVGIASDGSRSFAPVLGTGGNEGRLDYTNNFMSRIAALLIEPAPALPVGELLANALFGRRTTALQSGAAGQFDPGRAGGANQGPGIAHDSTTNPWDLVLTLEGAVAWASGIYRRQGPSYRTILCSPFTVKATKTGYGSASEKDDARAEVWAPLWRGRIRYAELKTLLREGRATVDGRAATNALEFAEAVRSLGVDRGIDRFVRYSLLKRRGDSYVALPTGTFAAGYRSEADLMRHFRTFFDDFSHGELPRGADDLRRGVDAAMFQVLLMGGAARIRELLRALGRMVRRAITTSETRLPRFRLSASEWLKACGFEVPEVRIAAALASICTGEVGLMAENLSRGGQRFAWIGSELPDRLAAVLERRLQVNNAIDGASNPLFGRCAIHPVDATLFIEGSVDDDAIEDLLFAFSTFDWKKFDVDQLNYSWSSRRGVLPVYAVLKHMFLAGEIRIGPEPKKVRADGRILPLLKADRLDQAAKIAVHRLRVEGFRPLEVDYAGGVDSRRLAGALLIPVRSGKSLAAGLFKEEERENHEPEFAR